jgi:hypothetical protein
MPSRCKPDLPGLRPHDIPGVPDSRFVRGVDRLYYVLPIIWAFANVAMGVVTPLNVTAILLLSSWAIAVLADYERSLAAGRQPVFVACNTLVCPLYLGISFGRGPTTLVSELNQFVVALGGNHQPLIRPVPLCLPIELHSIVLPMGLGSGRSPCSGESTIQQDS